MEYHLELPYNSLSLYLGGNPSEPIDTHNKSFMQNFIHSLGTLLSERIPLFICMFLVPDYVLAWAVRQWLVATEISKRTGWSKTHGFFIIMGGFHFFERTQGRHDYGKPSHPLTEADVILLFGNENIEFPADTEPQDDHPAPEIHDQFPAEVEIQDRSKSDWLAKTLVIVQTLWFIIQCIARGFARLPVTKLELVTLAYTAMNLGIYLAWWHKPYDVARPIRVFTDLPRKIGTGATKRLYDWADPNSGLQERVEWAGNYLIGSQEKFTDIRRAKKVPAFYSGEPDNGKIFIADAITLLVGVVFGAIHLIGWSFEFSSYTELLLWRISSATIAGVPLGFVVAGGIQTRFRNNIKRHIRGYSLNLVGFGVESLLNILASGVGVLIVILYIASRITTLVLAFTTLRSLPPAAYTAVSWTSFIPHI